MKNKIALLLFVSIIIFLYSMKDSGIFELKLKSLSNENYALNNLEYNKWSVIVFLLPDCPACESYSSTLNSLRTKYKNSGIEFYGVFPGIYNSIAEMKDFQKNYKINFPLLVDPEYNLVKTLNAKIVPTAFLIDNTGNILYQGRIDDWMYALGKKRVVITTHELNDALKAVTTDKPITITETKAIGCIIEPKN